LQSFHTNFTRATRSGGGSWFLGDMLSRSGECISPKREIEGYEA